MNYRVEFSPEALDDLIDLYDYIAGRDGAERAINMSNESRNIAAVSPFFPIVVRGVTICAVMAL